MSMPGKEEKTTLRVLNRSYESDASLAKAHERVIKKLRQRQCMRGEIKYLFIIMRSWTIL